MALKKITWRPSLLPAYSKMFPLKSLFDLLVVSAVALFHLNPFSDIQDTLLAFISIFPDLASHQQLVLPMAGLGPGSDLNLSETR